MKKITEMVSKNAHPRILFIDEKIFSMKEKFNHQNDHIRGMFQK